MATCPLPREEVEEVANAAVKEEQIETKLAAIESDWAVLNLVRRAAGATSAHGRLLLGQTCTDC